MTLTLKIENVDRLEDGGPLSVKVERHGIDIGRDAYLDWTLPDPSRHISGRHCEVRYENGAYYLFDVSTNGTYVNGGEHRVASPYQLQNGDELEIGPYVISVAIADEPARGAAPARPAAPRAVASPPPNASPSGADPWAVDQGADRPIDRNALKPKVTQQPVDPDFLEWLVDPPVAAGKPGAGDDWNTPGEDPWSVPENTGAAGTPTGPRRGPAAAPPEPRETDWLDALHAEPVRHDTAPPPADDEGVWRSPAVDEGQAPPAAPPAQQTRPAAATPPAGTPPAAAPPAGPAAAPPAGPAATGPPPAAAPGSAAEDAAFLRGLAAGARLPEDFFATNEGEALGELVGELLWVSVAHLQELLAARATAKTLARSTRRTMIQALDNNPVKFTPSPEEALRIVLGPKTSGYLAGTEAIEATFRDIKEHQVETYAAMRYAVKKLVEDIAPETIEAEVGDAKSLVSSRKARLWETYAARWKARSEPHEHGMLDCFMLYFAEFYDKSK